MAPLTVTSLELLVVKLRYMSTNALLNGAYIFSVFLLALLLINIFS